jgi:4a-hydroxytetrahydrobiopterin dehydratase
VAGVDLLTDEEITTGLASLPAWTRTGGNISRTVELTDFRDAMLFTGAVAYLAERANHHPDILIEWNKVTLRLSTHSAGGLTAADLALAGRIDELAPPLTAL